MPQCTPSTTIKFLRVGGAPRVCFLRHAHFLNMIIIWNTVKHFIFVFVYFLNIVMHHLQRKWSNIKELYFLILTK
jgi:hypothetical protein